VGQIVVAGGKRGHRGCVDLARRECFQHVLLEAEGRCRYVPLAEYPSRDGADQDADLRSVVEIPKAGDGAVPRHRQRHAGTIVRLGETQPGVGLSLWVSDRVEDDVAMRAENLRRHDDPLHRQADAELLGQRPAELNLKTRRIAGLAGKGQRVRMGAKIEQPTGPDHVERTRRGLSALAQGDRDSADSHQTPSVRCSSDAHPCPSGLRLWM